MTRWIPYSKRQTESDVNSFLELREGVPDGVAAAMIEFVRSHLYVQNIYMDMVINPELGSRYFRIAEQTLPQDAGSVPNHFWTNREQLLDVCDFAASNLPVGELWAERSVDQFNHHLIEARSVFVLRPNGLGYYGIQRRVGPELTRRLENLAKSTDRAAQLMGLAWNKAYGRHKDLQGACLEAIKAIEIVATPIFIPDEQKPTLGKALTALRDKPSKWAGDIAEQELVLLVHRGLEMLWTNHPRHGSQDLSMQVSEKTVEAFLGTALWLFDLLRNGSIRPA